MKSIATSICCITALAAAVSAQGPEERKARNQARAAARSLAMLAAQGGGHLLKSNYDAATVPIGLRAWLHQNEESVIEAGPSPFAPSGKWGVATTQGHKLFLHVWKWPESGKLQIPRIHNSVKSVHLSGDQAELKLMPNVADWVVVLPEKPKLKSTVLPVIVLELDGPVLVPGPTPPTVTASATGSIELHARYAIVHGEMLRFEPQSHKDTVGYWVNEKDWAEWVCSATKSGSYQVQLRYGCGQGQGGSEIEIIVGKQTLPFTVAATGGFQAWRNVNLGIVELPAGIKTTVIAKPKTKSKNAVMDIQQITLRPVN